MPYYVGTQTPLPVGKRGRCVLINLLNPLEKLILHDELTIQKQLEMFGFFIFETWECPKCFANIALFDSISISKHKCPKDVISSGAYVTETLTISGKVFPKRAFMTHKDIHKLAKVYLAEMHQAELDNKQAWKEVKQKNANTH